MNTAIRVNDAGRYQVGWTRNGIDFVPVGEPFVRPREAIDYSEVLEGRTPLPRLDGSAGTLYPAKVDRAEPEVPDDTQDASSVCAGCGGPVPRGRHGQRRLTCSPACRERARYRRAAAARGADPEAQPHNLTPSRPPEGPSLGARVHPSPAGPPTGQASPT